jgi:hypothetical protein
MTSQQFADPTNDNKMTKEQWLAVRKEPALQIDPETARFFAHTRRHSTPTASTPTSRRNTNKSGGNILPVLLEAPCGCGLVIYPTRPMIACGQESAPANLLTISPGFFDEPVP